MLKFIDQEELDKLGVEQKEEIEDDETLTDLQNFSLLQRFRQQKDLKKEQSFKPGVHKVVEKENHDSSNTVQKAPMSKLEKAKIEKAQKKKIEKERYLKAMRALAHEKG